MAAAPLAPSQSRIRAFDPWPPAPLPPTPAELAVGHARRHVREHADAAGVDALYE
jgi:hypothetical protein